MDVLLHQKIHTVRLESTGYNRVFGFSFRPFRNLNPREHLAVCVTINGSLISSADYAMRELSRSDFGNVTIEISFRTPLVEKDTLGVEVWSLLQEKKNGIERACEIIKDRIHQ
jgi:hypothetical protein